MSRSLLNWFFAFGVFAAFFGLLAIAPSNTPNHKQGEQAGGSATGNAIEVSEQQPREIKVTEETTSEELLAAPRVVEKKLVVPLQVPSMEEPSLTDLMGKIVWNKECQDNPHAFLCFLPPQVADTSSLYLLGGIFTQNEMDSLFSFKKRLLFLETGFVGVRGDFLLKEISQDYTLLSNWKTEELRSNIQVKQLHPNRCEISPLSKEIDSTLQHDLWKYYSLSFSSKEYLLQCSKAY